MSRTNAGLHGSTAAIQGYWRSTRERKRLLEQNLIKRLVAIVRQLIPAWPDKLETIRFEFRGKSGALVETLKSASRRPRRRIAALHLDAARLEGVQAGKRCRGAVRRATDARDELAADRGIPEFAAGRQRVGGAGIDASAARFAAAAGFAGETGILS